MPDAARAAPFSSSKRPGARARARPAPRPRGRQRLYARAIDVPRGRWTPQPCAEPAAASRSGCWCSTGLLVREATVGDHPCAELLGPGDLLRAWDDRDAEVLLPRTVEWTALTHARGSRSSTRRWPSAPRSGRRSSPRCVERAARRAERLVVMQAIAHLTRVDDRLLALLWCLAERWGRVVPGGVLVSLRLPHRTLAGMVGARRPSVTTALGQLMARGEIERRADGGVDPARRPAGAAHGDARAERDAPPPTRCASSADASASRGRAERPQRSERRRRAASPTSSPSASSRRACSRSSERPTVSAAGDAAAGEVEDR